MLDPQDHYEIHVAAAGGSELLLDFGTFITGGRHPRRIIVVCAWLLTLGGAVALWRWFPWLFDHFPGWAVLVGGSWLILFIVSLGLFGAAINYGPAPARTVGDEQSP
jgi:hypothetical protein